MPLLTNFRLQTESFVKNSLKTLQDAAKNTQSGIKALSETLSKQQSVWIKLAEEQGITNNIGSNNGRFILYALEFASGLLVSLILGKLIGKVVRNLAIGNGTSSSSTTDSKNLDSNMKSANSESNPSSYTSISTTKPPSSGNNYNSGSSGTNSGSSGTNSGSSGTNSGSSGTNSGSSGNTSGTNTSTTTTTTSSSTQTVLEVCDHNTDRLITDCYDLGAVLGKGSFAKVVKGIRNKHLMKDSSMKTSNHHKHHNYDSVNKVPAGYEVAIKIVKLDSSKMQQSANVLNKELEVLRKLDPFSSSNKSNTTTNARHVQQNTSNRSHPGAQHTVLFLEAFEGMFEGHLSLFLVKELCNGGELFDLITEKEKLKERHTGICMRQLLLAIQYTHSCGVSHRCPKPEDLLLKHKLVPVPIGYRTMDSFSTSTDGSGGYDELDYAIEKKRFILQLTDFGMGSTFDAHSSLSKERDGRFTTRQGTPYYVAPEVISGSEFNRMCDLWSCGVICYILLSGYPPFFADTDLEVLGKIKDARFDFPKQDFEHTSEGAKELIRKLLTKDVKKRWDTGNGLNSNFLKMYAKWDLPYSGEVGGFRR